MTSRADSSAAPAGRSPGGSGGGGGSEEGAPLADRIGFIVGGQFITTLISLFQGVLMVRLLSKGDYGTLAFVMVIFGTGRDLGQLYIPESMLYFAPKVSAPELKGLVRQSMVLLLGLALLVALIFAGLASAPGLLLGGRHGLTTILLLAGLATIVGFPASVYGNLFIATNNHRKAAGIGLFVTLIGSAGALIPAALGWPVETIFAFMVLSLSVRFILSERLFRSLYPGVKRAPFPGGIRAQLAYVVPLAVTRFAGIFNQKLDKFIVGLFFSADAFAEFSIAAQELPLVSILPYTIASTMLPQLVALYDGSPSRLEGARSAVSLWHAGIRKATIVMVPVAAFLLICADPLMIVLYGQKYSAAAMPFRIYSALLPLRVTAYGTMLMAFGNTKWLMPIQIGGMVFNTAASFLLLPRVGMIAAPLGAVLTQAFMIVLMCVRINAVARVGLRGIFPWAHYGRVAFAAVVAGLPLLAASLTPSIKVHPAIFLAFGIPLFSFLYLTLANAVGVLADEDRAYVKRWLRLEPLRRKPAPPASPAPPPPAPATPPVEPPPPAEGT